MSRPGAAIAAVELPAHTRPAPLAIASGTLEAMKWLALVLMTVDHVNKYLLNHVFNAMFAFGRIAMPLFVFVLAYNLARPGNSESGAYQRTTARLALYGLLACIPFIALGKVQGGWWPMNIMFTLLVATGVIGLIESGGRMYTIAAIALFIVGGALVEYWWFALSLVIVSWRYCKRPCLARLLALAGCIAALSIVNRTAWALAALPLILLAPHVKLSVPRTSLFFYVYYPAHLGVLFVLSTCLHY